MYPSITSADGRMSWYLADWKSHSDPCVNDQQNRQALGTSSFKLLDFSVAARDYLACRQLFLSASADRPDRTISCIAFSASLSKAITAASMCSSLVSSILL